MSYVFWEHNDSVGEGNMVQRNLDCILYSEYNKQVWKKNNFLHMPCNVGSKKLIIIENKKNINFDLRKQ